MKLLRRSSVTLVVATVGLLLGIRSHAEVQLAVSDSQTSSTTSAQTTAASSADDGWHLALSPYLWLAGTHGTVGVLGNNASFQASAGDLLSHLDFGIMGAAEARRKRFLLNGDMIWIRLSDSSALPFPALGAVSADVRIGQFVWTSKVGYRVIDHANLKADANVGVRYWHLGQSLRFNPSVFGVDLDASQSWADIVVGGRVLLPVGKKVAVNLLGDVGGWDATAKQDYQVAAVLEYKLTRKWALAAGYRYMFVDYRNGPGAVYNTVTSGAVLGATWTLK